MASWNIQSPTNLTPLYWDSPYFTLFENYTEDSRDRFYGNYSLGYSFNKYLDVSVKIHLDNYSFTTEDRIGTGGLELDDYSVTQIRNREINYEFGLNYKQDFEKISLIGFFGANLRQDRYNYIYNSAEGGLNTPNLSNIDGSIDRPTTIGTIREQDERSLFGSFSIGYMDMIYVETTARNDWASTLPADDNSFLYLGLSTSLIFTEFDVFNNQNILSLGKLRASIAQVGNSIAPYQISQTYSIEDPYGGYPSLTLPNTLPNETVQASISTDYEAGIDLRFLDGRIRLDGAYYVSKIENEILNLDVSTASGYEKVTINAGEFTTTGLETQLGVTAIQNRDLNIDFSLNWATSHSVVDKLADGLTSREIEDAYFGVSLYAMEGEEWGVAQAEGYYGYNYHENGEPIIVDGFYDTILDKKFGSILPDWTGGFRTDVRYKNFTLGTFLDFQKGGLFYSITKMFNNYSGLGIETVGNNTLGNPVRDPVLDESGNEVDYVSLDVANANSGGELVSGVDEYGNAVQYLYNATSYHAKMFYNKENWLYDASYIKLREVSVTYAVPTQTLSKTPIRKASISLILKNALLLYSSVDDLDPSTIQNGTSGFSFWEGGTLPGTRSIGFTINLGF